MLKTELKLPFVFYNNIKKQHRFRPQNTAGHVYPLICSNDRLLPFQIRKSKTDAGVSEFKIYDGLDTPVLDLSSVSLEVVRTEDAEYLTYKGAILGLTIPQGCYYVKIVKGSTYYSEFFQVVEDISHYLKLTWYNGCDVAPVLYQTGFKNWIYLDTYTEATPPEITEEGVENGVGEHVTTLQRIVHKHKIETFAPDFLLDALTFMQIHGNVILADFTDETEIRNIKVTPRYEDYLGTCKIEFELPGDYIRTNCCSNMTLEGPAPDPDPDPDPTCAAVDIYGPVVFPNPEIGVPYYLEVPLRGDGPFVVVVNNKPEWMAAPTVDVDVLKFTGTPDVDVVEEISITVTNCEGKNSININGYIGDHSSKFDHTEFISGDAENDIERSHWIGEPGAVLTFKITDYTNTNRNGRLMMNGSDVYLDYTFSITLDSDGKGWFPAEISGDATDTGTAVIGKFELINTTSIYGIGSPSSFTISKIF